MQSVSKKLEEKLMRLPAIDRACIAEKLLSSLDSSKQKEIDAAWANESEDRIRAFDQGNLQASEDSEVYQRLEKNHNI
jgi:putative addiction module component (TIGR02574 family)